MQDKLKLEFDSLSPGIEDFYRLLIQTSLVFSLILSQGFILGLAYSFILIKGYEIVLARLFNLRPLYAIDHLFIYDSNKNRSNITGTLIHCLLNRHSQVLEVRL